MQHTYFTKNCVFFKFFHFPLFHTGNKCDKMEKNSVIQWRAQMEMMKLHRSNLVIVWIGIAAMTALTLLANGGNILSAVNGVVVLIVCQR